MKATLINAEREDYQTRDNQAGSAFYITILDEVAKETHRLRINQALYNRLRDSTMVPVVLTFGFIKGKFHSYAAVVDVAVAQAAGKPS